MKVVGSDIKLMFFHKVILWGNQGGDNHKLKQNFNQIAWSLKLQISYFKNSPFCKKGR